MTAASAPFVSVIIPTYRRPAALERCLASLAAQDYAHDRFEVIVVEDGGTESPVGWTTPSGICVTRLPVPHGGPAVARNRGAEVARGELLLFIDDDCTADARWLSTMVAQAGTHADAAIGGQVTNAVPDNRYARASQTLITFLYQYYHEKRQGLLPFFTTNNLCIRAEPFHRQGGFDAAFAFASEDRDWCDRWVQTGGQLVYAPDAVVHHAPQLSFTGFVRQHFRYGEGAWQFHRARARRSPQSMEIEPFDFYAGMLRAPFVLGDKEPIRQSLLLFGSQAIAAVGYAVSALRDSRAD
jgi:GT2 family glycosyltransferase